MLRVLEETSYLREQSAAVSYIMAMLVMIIMMIIRVMVFGDGASQPHAPMYLGVVLCALLLQRGTGVFAAVCGGILLGVQPNLNTPAFEFDILRSGWFVAVAGLTAILVETLEVVRVNLDKDRARLQLADQRNKTLLDDINHRIKNHLSGLAGLVLHARRKIPVGDPCRAILQTIANRMMVLARVYDRLQLDGDDAMAVVASRPFLQQICDGLQETIIGDRPIDLHTDFDDVEFTNEEASAVGLLLNEIITNATKHAFETDDDGGHIWVEFKENDKMRSLCVSDNGSGNIDKTGSGTGTRLIQNLTDQLKGQIEVTRSHAGGRLVNVHYPVK